MSSVTDKGSCLRKGDGVEKGGTHQWEIMEQGMQGSEGAFSAHAYKHTLCNVAPRGRSFLNKVVADQEKELQKRNIPARPLQIHTDSPGAREQHNWLVQANQDVRAQAVYPHAARAQAARPSQPAAFGK